MAVVVIIKFQIYESLAFKLCISLDSRMILKFRFFAPSPPSSEIGKKCKHANSLYNMFSEISEQQLYNGVSH